MNWAPFLKLPIWDGKWPISQPFSLRLARKPARHDLAHSEGAAKDRQAKASNSKPVREAVIGAVRGAMDEAANEDVVEAVRGAMDEAVKEAVNEAVDETIGEAVGLGLCRLSLIADFVK